MSRATKLISAVIKKEIVLELHEKVSKLDQWKIHKFNSSHEIQWCFILPAARHRGGIQEGMVRSVSRILFDLCNQGRLTEDSPNTILVEVEGILNNRPLVLHRDGSFLKPVCRQSKVTE